MAPVSGIGAMVPPFPRTVMTRFPQSTSCQRSATHSPRRHPDTDPPPSKWPALRYGFRAKEDHDAEEETQARGDRCEAAPGGRAGVARAERCRRGTLDWRDRG